MKPSMKQSIVANIPVYDSNGKQIKDKYGRPLTEKKSSIARVQRKASLVLDSKGQERKASIEIDLPPNFEIESGTLVDFTTITGQKGSGIVVSIEEITNLTASRIYYKVLSVDEQTKS